MGSGGDLPVPAEQVWEAATGLRPDERAAELIEAGDRIEEAGELLGSDRLAPAHDRPWKRVKDRAQSQSTPSLADALSRVGAKDVAVPGLRPCFRYPARLPRGSFGGLGDQLCFSDVLFRSAPLARQLLGLPYEPVCRLAVANAEWEVFPGGGTTRRRAWAAFGQPGGAFETASSRRFHERGPRGVARWRLDERMPAGGASDEYCSVASPDERGGFIELVRLIAATAMEFAASLTETGTPATAKIVDERVAAAVVHWTQGAFEHSLSVSARVHGEYVNGLKLWAAFWRDDARLRVRHLSKPLELTAPGAVVARLTEMEAYSWQSDLLMTTVWEQFDALRRLLTHKAAAECWSEFSHHVLP